MSHTRRGVYYAALKQVLPLTGFLKWYSRLYRNQGSLLFGPGRFDWGEQVVVITGGTCTFDVPPRDLLRGL